MITLGKAIAAACLLAQVATAVQAQDLGVRPLRYGNTSGWYYDNRDDDRDVPTYLRWFTLWPLERIAALETAIAERPDAREAQRHLAFDVTARVHGADEARAAVEVSAALFQRDPVTDAALLARIHAATRGPEATPDAVAGGVAVLLAETGLAASRSEARRLITGGAISVNGERVTDPTAAVPAAVAQEWLEVRVGKRSRAVVRVAGG